jgi:hypothetical protein
VRYGDTYRKGKQYNGGTQAAPIGSEMSGTWTAITANTNKIAWQKNIPFRVGSGGGSTTTAGGLVFHGDPGGNIQVRDAKTGELLWQFQTGFGVEAPPMVYEVDGEEYVAVAAGGNQGVGSANGDAVWAFSLKGQVNALWPPPQPAMIAGPATGPIADGVNAVKIGDNNIEFGYFPKRTQVKAGTAITFTNAGDTPHTATARRAQFRRVEDDHLRQAGQLLLHLHAASVDVRTGHRRVISRNMPAALAAEPEQRAIWPAKKR